MYITNYIVKKLITILVKITTNLGLVSFEAIFIDIQWLRISNDHKIPPCIEPMPELS